MSARRTRRKSSSLLPLNITPAMTSMVPGRAKLYIEDFDDSGQERAGQASARRTCEFVRDSHIAALDDDQRGGGDDEQARACQRAVQASRAVPQQSPRRR